MSSKVRVTHVSFSQNHFMKFIHILFLTLNLIVPLTIKLALNINLTPNPKAIFNRKPKP